MYLVDWPVWKNSLLPKKTQHFLLEQLSRQQTGISSTFCHATNTRLNDMHQIPQAGSQVVVMTNSFSDSTWRQRPEEKFFVRSHPREN